MIDADPVQAFDLPDHLDVDHVVIYPNNDPDEPHFRAVPFKHSETWDDGTKSYEEIAPFDVTEEYLKAVANLASMDIEDVKLRSEIATYPLEEVEPL